MILYQRKVNKRIATADPEDDKKQTSEPLVLGRRILVNEHEEESTQRRDRNQGKKENFLKLDLLTRKNIVVDWIAAAHDEDADSTVV